VGAVNKVLGCILFAALLGTTWAVAQTSDVADKPEPDIRVRIYNLAQVPENILAEAVGQATYIFARAGIRLGWMDCLVHAGKPEVDPDCRQPYRPFDLALKIALTSTGFVKPGDTFGLALLPENNTCSCGIYAYVFYEPVLRLSSEYRFNGAMVLAHIIAHEIGHLLLGSNSHSPSGVMTAQWHETQLKKAAMGSMLFDDKQVNKIHDAIRSRRSNAERPGAPYLPVFGRCGSPHTPCPAGWPGSEANPGCRCQTLQPFWGEG
jgi:hypothetical protein